MAKRDSPDPQTTTLPPQDMEAEQATIGACLVEPGAAALALATLGPADFYPEATSSSGRRSPPCTSGATR
jgi:hypothetical protein